MSIIQKLKNPNYIQALTTISEQVYTSITFFVVGVLLARNTTKDDFALYILGFSIIMIVLGFQKAIINVPFTILLRDFHTKRKQDYENYLLYFEKVFISLVIMFLFIVISIYNIFYDSTYNEVFLSFSLFIIAYLLFYYMKLVFLSKLDTKNNLIFGGISNTAILIILSIYLLYFDNLTTIITNYLLGLILLILFLYYYNFNIQRKETIKIKKLMYIKKNWELGKWIAGSNFLFIFTNQIYPWLLLIVSNKNNIANLAVILSISKILGPLSQGLWSFLLPKMTEYRNELTMYKNIIIKLVLFMSIISLFLISFAILFGAELITLIYGEQYSNLGLAVILGFILQALVLINMPIDAGLNGLKDTRTGFNSLIVSLIITLIIGIPLTVYYNYVGALIGLIIATFFGILYRVYKLKRLLIKEFKDDKLHCI